MTPTIDELNQDERRCLRALRRKSLYDGALPLILGKRVSKDPHEVMRDLAKKKLVGQSKATWSLTSDGEKIADELISAEDGAA